MIHVSTQLQMSTTRPSVWKTGKQILTAVPSRDTNLAVEATWSKALLSLAFQMPSLPLSTISVRILNASLTARMSLCLFVSARFQNLAKHEVVALLWRDMLMLCQFERSYSTPFALLRTFLFLQIQTSINVMKCACKQARQSKERTATIT